MASNEIFSQLKLRIYILNLTHFASIFYPLPFSMYMSGSGSLFGIRIHKAPENG